MAGPSRADPSGGCGGHGPVRAVGAGVHPGLVRALGGRAVQRGGGAAHPQEQPQLRRAGQALLPPHLGRSVLGAERVVYTGRGRRRRRSLPPAASGVPHGCARRGCAGGTGPTPLPGHRVAVTWSRGSLGGGARLPGLSQVTAVKSA